MQSQRTAVIVSLIIGLAIGVAVLMVLWVCAVCFSKSRTKDDEQHVHEEARRNERADQPDAVVALPEVMKVPSKPRKVTLHHLSPLRPGCDREYSLFIIVFATVHDASVPMQWHSDCSVPSLSSKEQNYVF